MHKIWGGIRAEATKPNAHRHQTSNVMRGMGQWGGVGTAVDW